MIVEQRDEKKKKIKRTRDKETTPLFTLKNLPPGDQY